MPLDIPSSAVAGPRGWRLVREEAGSPPSHLPSQHGKAQESSCVVKNPHLSPGKELCCSGVTCDAQRCGQGSEGSWRGGSLGKHLERVTGEVAHLLSPSVYHISVPHPVLVLFLRQCIPVLISAIHYNRKPSKGQENAVNTKPVCAAEPTSHGVEASV